MASPRQRSMTRRNYDGLNTEESFGSNNSAAESSVWVGNDTRIANGPPSDSVRWPALFTRMIEDYNIPRHYFPYTTCDFINPSSLSKNFGIGTGWVDFSLTSETSTNTSTLPASHGQIQYHTAWQADDLMLQPRPGLTTLHAPVGITPSARLDDDPKTVKESHKTCDPVYAMQELAQLYFCVSGRLYLARKHQLIIEKRIQFLLRELGLYELHDEHCDSLNVVGGKSEFCTLTATAIQHWTSIAKQCMTMLSAGDEISRCCFVSGRALDSVSFCRLEHKCLSQGDSNNVGDDDFSHSVADVKCGKFVYEICSSKADDGIYSLPLIVARHAQSFSVLVPRVETDHFLEESYDVATTWALPSNNCSDALAHVVVNPRVSSEIACLSRRKLMFFNFDQPFGGADFSPEYDYKWDQIAEDERDGGSVRHAYYGSHLNEFCIADGLRVMRYDTRLMNKNSLLGQLCASDRGAVQPVVDFTNPRLLYNDATFGVENIEHSFLFDPHLHCAVSNRRIMLFDVRQTATPLLQWPNILNDADLRGELPTRRSWRMPRCYTQYVDTQKVTNSDETMLLLGNYESCQLLRVRANVGTCSPATAIGFPLRVYSHKLASRHLDDAGVDGSRVAAVGTSTQRIETEGVALPADDMLDARPIIGAVLVVRNDSRRDYWLDGSVIDDDDGRDNVLADRVGVLLVSSVGRIYLRKFSSTYD